MGRVGSARALVAAGHHLEEQLGVARVAGKIADLVDDEDGGRGIAVQAASQRGGGILCCEVMEHVGGADEACAMSMQYRLRSLPLIFLAFLAHPSRGY